MRKIALLLTLCLSVVFSTDYCVFSPLDSAQNARARIVGIMIGATKRTPDLVANVQFQVTKYNLPAIDATVYGFLSQRSGDNNVSCSGSVVTSTDSPWSITDIGKTIHIPGAGSSGAMYVGVISSYTNSNSIGVFPPISTAIVASKISSGGGAMWGFSVPYQVDNFPLTSNDGSFSYQPAPSTYIFDVTKFGAVGDGVNDDTGAINAAFFAAANASKAISSTEIPGIQSYLNSASTPDVVIPAGKYKISSSVGNGANNVNIRGQRAYLFSSDRTVKLLSVGTVNVRISGMLFDGGAVHVRIGGSRVEAGFVHIHDCEFRNAKTRCVQVDRSDIPGFSGYPMNLRIDNCKSYGCGFLEFYCNGVSINNCWLAWDTSGTTWDGGPLFIGNDKLSCVGVCEVPFNSNTNQYPRFQTPPATFPTEDYLAVSCTDCRFGGEATTTPIMYVKCKYSSLRMDGCAIFGVAGCYWLKCDQMPEFVSIKNCLGGNITGFVNTWGMWFNNTTIGGPDVPAQCRFDLDLRTAYVAAWEAIYSNSSTTQGGSRYPAVPNNSTIQQSDAVQRNLNIGDGITFWAGPYTLNTSNAGFGGTTSMLGYTVGLANFSGEGYFGIKMPSWNPTIAGVYTFSAWVKTSSRVSWSFTANDGGPSICGGVLEQGLQQIKATFYHDGSIATTPTFLITGKNGDSHAIGLMKLESGYTATRFVTPSYAFDPGLNRQFYGASVPATGTWRVGDAIINSAPAVGSPKGWRCTVAGSPGTWVSEGNL